MAGPARRSADINQCSEVADDTKTCNYDIGQGTELDLQLWPLACSQHPVPLK